MLTNFKLLPNIFIVLICIYYSQEIIYASGSLISQISLLGILSFGFLSFLKTIKERENFKNNFFLMWTLLLFLNLIGFIFTGDLSNSIHISNIKSILITSLSFYTIFYFSKSNIWSLNNLYLFLILIIPISIIQYFNYEKEQLLLENKKEIVNN